MLETCGGNLHLGASDSDSYWLHLHLFLQIQWLHMALAVLTSVRIKLIYINNGTFHKHRPHGTQVILNYFLHWWVVVCNVKNACVLISKALFIYHTDTCFIML